MNRDEILQCLSLKPVKRERKAKVLTSPMKTRYSSNLKASETPKRKLEVVKALGRQPRKLEVVKCAKSHPTVPNKPRNKTLEVVACTPKLPHDISLKTPNMTRKDPDSKVPLKLEVFTPKPLRKRALDMPPKSSKKLKVTSTSPITKTLQVVTESLIKKNQFQADTPSKSFKIYRSKNGEDVEDEQEKPFDEFPMISPSPKKVQRPRVELASQYKGSNVSFDDGEIFKIF
jgi:hypothetical protein